MITIEQALDLVLANLPACRAERVPFERALGCVLAEDVAAPHDFPPFDRSAMDGYALRAEDVRAAPVRLELVGEIRAGGGPPGRVLPGQAKAIMTGAPMPEGADAVVTLEQARPSPDRRQVLIAQAVGRGENVRPKGSDALRGATVLEAGRYVGPAEIAVMAVFGRAEAAVWRRPRVAVLCTGDELVEAAQEPAAGQIRNSNAFALRAQLRCLGIEGDYLGIARDDKGEIRTFLQEGLQRDVVIVTGGVSVGEYDLVEDALRDMGLEIVFNKVAVRPGKPTVFARGGDRLVFALPGNPVSSFVTFELLVRPALGRMCGLHAPELPRVRGALARDVRQAPGRTSFLPARASRRGAGWRIEPLEWRGSGDIIGFARGNAALIFPRELDFLPAGGEVEAVLFPAQRERGRT
jgi:molybdopterin molybdotransferase